MITRDMAVFQPLLKQLTTASVKAVPGAVVLASKHGNDILRTSSGFATLGDTPVPISFNNTFQWSSSTKIVTAIAALQCVERGQIGLDDTIYKYLPELKDQPIATLTKPDDGQSPELKLASTTREMTLRHLLTHTSGITSDFMNPALSAWRKSRGEISGAFSGNAVQAISQPLAFDPGEGWSYGSGYDALGLLIARLNDLPDLEDYMVKNIFQPLGLKTPTFMPEDHPKVLEYLAQTYMHNPNGDLVLHVHGTTGKNPTISQGGGGLYSTAPDYHAILADIVSEHPKLLKAETAELLFAPQLQEGTKAMKDFGDGKPMFDVMLGSLSQGLKTNHSLGGFLVLEDSPDVGKTKGTATWAGASGTFWVMNREQGLAGVYGSQLFPIMDPQGLQLIDGFVKEVWRLAES